MKDKVKRIFTKIKKFFSKKKNIIITSIVLVAIILVIIILSIPKEKKDKFALSSIYDVYPEEVRELYKNTVSVSCKGDLYLDIELDGGVVDAINLDKETLIDYVFSYLDKEDLLETETSKNTFESAVDKLFVDDIELLGEINNYIYDKYAYTYSSEDKVIVREKTEECEQVKDYYSQLYGYSYNEELLSVDINFGYKKGNDLYDLSDKKLGKFENEVNAQSLFGRSSYYRYNFVKEDGTYKLKSVQWMNRI